MSEAEAEAALQEFLVERGPALARLREAMEADGQNANVILDETVKSLRPVWAWVMSVVAEPDTEEMEPVAVGGPSWLRHCIGNKPALSRESVMVVDGLISYVCRVVERGAPHARWRVGHKPIKSWVWENHPVLAVGEDGWALGELILRTAQPIGGRIRSDEGALALRVKAFIDQLHRAGNATLGDEPLVEVEDIGEDPLRGRELEVALREDIAHKYSRVVDRMAKNLAKENGITGVIREDREVLLVATSSWNAEQLEAWVTRHLAMKIPD